MGFLCFFNGLRAHIELLARAAFVHFVRFVRPGRGSSPGWPGALWQPLGRAWEGPGRGPRGSQEAPGLEDLFQFGGRALGLGPFPFEGLRAGFRAFRASRAVRALGRPEGSFGGLGWEN